jgi:membrane carboxypeptidase/penicillin-binding protein PbpC
MNKDFGMRVETDFYVISQMGKRRFLDIIGRDLVIKTRNGRKTQKWYFHQKSLTIRSRSNNQSWDIKSSGRTNNMQVYSTNGNSVWW